MIFEQFVGFRLKFQDLFIIHFCRCTLFCLRIDFTWYFRIYSQSKGNNMQIIYLSAAFRKVVLTVLKRCQTYLINKNKMWQNHISTIFFFIFFSKFRRAVFNATNKLLYLRQIIPRPSSQEKFRDWIANIPSRQYCN